jgi:hypothetical protein
MHCIEVSLSTIDENASLSRQIWSRQDIGSEGLTQLEQIRNIFKPTNRCRSRRSLSKLRAALTATTVIVRRAAPHGDRRDADEGFHPRRSCAKRSRDTDEGQPMAIWDSINQVYFEGRDSTAGCSGWENRLAYRASCRSPSEYREDCPCKP